MSHKLKLSKEVCNHIYILRINFCENLMKECLNIILLTEAKLEW